MNVNNKNSDIVMNFIKDNLNEINGNGEFANDSDLLNAVAITIEILEENDYLTMTYKNAKE